MVLSKIQKKRRFRSGIPWNNQLWRKKTVQYHTHQSEVNYVGISCSKSVPFHKHIICRSIQIITFDIHMQLKPFHSIHQQARSIRNIKCRFQPLNKSSSNTRLFETKEFCCCLFPFLLQDILPPRTWFQQWWAHGLKLKLGMVKRLMLTITNIYIYVLLCL